MLLIWEDTMFILRELLARSKRLRRKDILIDDQNLIITFKYFNKKGNLLYLGILIESYRYLCKILVRYLTWSLRSWILIII